MSTASVIITAHIVPFYKKAGGNPIARWHAYGTSTGDNSGGTQTIFCYIGSNVGADPTLSGAAYFDLQFYTWASTQNQTFSRMYVNGNEPTTSNGRLGPIYILGTGTNMQATYCHVIKPFIMKIITAGVYSSNVTFDCDNINTAVFSIYCGGFLYVEDYM